jgi:hypothetical protein
MDRRISSVSTGHGNYGTAARCFTTGLVKYSSSESVLSMAAPEVLLQATVAAVSPAVSPGAPALQTLDWELTPAKVPS